ncbi:MAG TPA: hypothetical protein VIY26_07890 [Acidimicrobiales bacterium]
MSDGHSGSDQRGRDVEEATKVEEAREAIAAHTSDRPPTSEEEAAAEGNPLQPGVSEHEREMGKIGAEVKGEGEVD